MPEYEYSVVDERCNCRWQCSEEIARAVMRGERPFWGAGRESGPLRLDIRTPGGEWRPADAH